MVKIIKALSELYKASHVPVRVVSGEKQLLLFLSTNIVRDLAGLDIEKVAKDTGECDYPVIEECPNGMVIYFRDGSGNLYIYGPSKISKSPILRCVVLSVFLIKGKVYSEYEIVQLNRKNDEGLAWERELVPYHLEISENETFRFSYRTEEKLLDFISNGDVERVTSFLGRTNFSGVGRMANSDAKQFEYLAVSSITLSTRAAIKGGMDPYEAYELSDVYLQKLENCRTTSEIIDLNCLSMKTFAEKVRDCKRAPSSSVCVKKCKEYISRIINQNISVSKMTEELGYSRSYLSSRFRQEVGITIQQYIMEEKIKFVQKLLQYSEFSISTISDFLGFYSQSHMGQHFKKLTGMSPSDYREKNQIVDFLTRQQEISRKVT